MSSKESLPYPPPPTKEQDHPHACNNGWVSMEVEAIDPETGEETREEALYLCRRCTGDVR
jgi:hypothetical protein